ncbi:MAG TPA: GNAT family N-acetyltransferase [Mycobacteriales bacterium]|nr:GNAT family N-acetyltransferase [Mycobacteriales bacterium]
MGQEVSIALVDSFAEIDPAEWDDLVAATGAPVFYTSTYLRAYEREPMAPVEAVRYLVGRSAGRPVLLAPLYLYRHLDPLGRLRLVYPCESDEPGLLSHVWHCYDSQLVGPGSGAGSISAVVAAIRRAARQLGARWCGFVNVEQGTPTHRALAAAGLPTHHIEDRFAVDLTGVSDLDGYLARIPGRYRRDLYRQARRAAEAGARAEVRAIADIDIDEVAALCRATADRFDNRGFYPEGRFERFVELVGPLGHVVEVRQLGRLMGVFICLVDGDRLHTWTGGYDPAVDGNFSAYGLCFTASIELALRLRRPVLEGGRRNPEYKRRHGLGIRHLDACLVPA